MLHGASSCIIPRKVWIQWLMRPIIWRQTRCSRLSSIRPCIGRQLTTSYSLRREITSSSPEKSQQVATSRLEAPLANELAHSDDPKLASSDPPQARLDQILKDASQHGIHSLEKLVFESDVGHLRDRGTRFTDNRASRQDLEMWSVLLDYRYLVDGIRGVRGVIFGMKARGPPVKLYAGDKFSHELWDKILPIVISDKHILMSVCDAHIGLGREIPTLCIDVIGQLLLKKEVDLAVLAAGLLRPLSKDKKQIVDVFELVLSAGGDVDGGPLMEGFRRCHERLLFFHMYGSIIPRLWDTNRVADAFMMHSYLVRRGDYPTSFDQVEPFVRHLAQQEASLGPFLRELEAHGVSYSMQARRVFSEEVLLKQGLPSDAAGLSVGGQSRKPSDEFLARAFATRSFSFDFVMRSLTFFGVHEIGPLAMREIASSAESVAVLKERFRTLERLKIDVGASAFVVTIKNLCEAECESLLQAVLASDQHHEVFEDMNLQKRLLTDYYRNDDWPSVNRTLAIMNRGRMDSAAQHQSFKYLLQTAFVLRDWRGALKMLLDKQRQAQRSFFKEQSTSLTLAFILRMILPPRVQTSYSSQEFLHRPRYAAGFLQELETAGFNVSPASWRKLLWTLGSRTHWLLLERLSTWIAWYYCSEDSARRSLHSSRVSIDDIFDPELQAAIVYWSFCSAPVHSPGFKEVTQSSRRGLKLLRHLEAVYKLSLDYDQVKEIFSQRLRQTLSTQSARAYDAFFDAVWHESQDLVAHSQSTRNWSVFHRQGHEILDQWTKSSPSWNGDATRSMGIEVDEDMLDSALHHALGEEQGKEEDVVEYSDLFHPSWKEFNP